MFIIAGIFFDGLAFGMLLFTITVGLSITMGVMHFTNLAHGAFAMAGGYLLVSMMNYVGLNFYLSLLLVFFVITGVGLVFERLVFRHFYAAPPLEQVLLTIGIVFMSVATARWLFGPLSVGISIPDHLKGSIDTLGFNAPVYRVLLIVIGCFVAVGLWVVQERTLVGAKLRAAVENGPMAQAVRINVPVMLSLVFAVGAGLAGLGGALSVALLGLTPTYAFDYLVLVLIIVIVGGMGTIKGAFFASLLIGMVDNAGKFLFPELGAFFVYFIALAILMWRPLGLLGK